MSERFGAPDSEKKQNGTPRASDAGVQDLSGAVHDVSQLLAAVMGRAGLLLRRGPGEDWPTHMRAIELAARDASVILARLVGGASGASTASDRETTVLQAASQIAALIVPPESTGWNADPQGAWRLEISVPTDLRTTVPAQIVREVLGNLLLNSLEAAPEGVKVRLTADGTQDEITVTLSDDGPGIAPELQSGLFATGTGSAKGVHRGIGLAHCRRLLQETGGELRLARNQTTGAAFEMVLPIDSEPLPIDSNPAADKSTAPVHPQREVSPRKILIVDDEAAVREMLVEVMSELGGDVTAVRDSVEAERVFVAGQFDLVVLDQSLPGMQGDELARCLREKDPAVAIALATGWGNEEKLAEAESQNVDLTGTKPLEMAKMANWFTAGSALTDRRRQGTDS